MLCLSGFELYSRWVPLKLLSYVAVCIMMVPTVKYCFSWKLIMSSFTLSR